MITWRRKLDKFIICKDGAYMALTVPELLDLYDVVTEIRSGGTKFYAEDSRKKINKPNEQGKNNGKQS